MMVLDETYNKALKEWQALEQSDVPVFFVGAATCGCAAGAGEVLDRLKQELGDRHMEAQVIEVGCMGPCYMEPLMIVHKPGAPQVLYGNVTPGHATEILEKHVLGDDPCAEYALGTLAEEPLDGIARFEDHPLMKLQVRRVLRNCGIIDPENINHYFAREGYKGFIKALEMGADQVLEEVKNSGLRGRGGAGFPTWRKWEFCRGAQGDTKYLICNADEGDPGAFMNRSLIEGDPHAVLEGMLIAGFCLGATEGYIYCRAEYPLAIQRLEIALKQMKQHSLLGDNILDSGFSFHIKIKEGAGAFVCGEETSLIASIEGRRGMPQPRPPFPAVSGLWGKPTVIQNVESLGNLPLILNNGAAWYTQYGSESSKGTKTFALAGKIKHTGLVEVPLGITLREVIYDIGGGVEEGKNLKAVQTGGPSGGCIPADKIDLPVDYESLAKAGSIMGSGGMIVLDEDSCVVDLAAYFLKFTQAESCGKCPPCRVGTRAMLTLLEYIGTGHGSEEDLAKLESLAKTVKSASLCGLGQTAPNPVLTTLRYFREEYQTHIGKDACPAFVCTDLVTFEIDESLCAGCGACARLCPVDAIEGEKKAPHRINQEICIRCGMCLRTCPPTSAAVYRKSADLTKFEPRKEKKK